MHNTTGVDPIFEPIQRTFEKQRLEEFHIGITSTDGSNSEVFCGLLYPLLSGTTSEIYIEELISALNIGASQREWQGMSGDSTQGYPLALLGTLQK